MTINNSNSIIVITRMAGIILFMIIIKKIKEPNNYNYKMHSFQTINSLKYCKFVAFYQQIP